MQPISGSPAGHSRGGVGVERAPDPAAGRTAGAVALDVGEDDVAVVTLSRLPHNYLEEADVADLGDAFFEAAESGARCIVLASTGRNFCAGASLQSKLGGGVTFDMYRHIPRLFEHPLPVVAAVQGRAVGAGLGLALVADFRVATARSSFVAPFTSLGFHHGFGLSATLPRVVGPQRASAMLLAGVVVRGEEAHRIGLADRLATEDDLGAEALAFAREIAAAAPLAVGAVRTSLRGGLAAEVRAALAAEQGVQERLMKTEDFLEGVAAAADRRDPHFCGR
jgi:2-(1,2-epoxy-1,2-dihydrophenyl)acetyl-CoA isomerase